MNLSVIIPNHNGAKLLENCVVSLKKSLDISPISKYEIIVVDNNSNDDSILVSKKHRLKFIRLDKNHGFSVAVNKGILKSKYSNLCIVNNDISVDHGWFSNICKAFKNEPQYAAYCGTVLNKDGSLIESQGMDFEMSGKAININNGFRYNPKYSNKSTEVWGSSAAIVMYKKSAITRAGLFDESFFAYIEDVDLSYRLKKLGYKTTLIPTAISYHLGGATSDKMGKLRAKQTFVNWFKVIIKNYTFKEILLNLPGIVDQRIRNFSYLIKSYLII